MNEVIHPLIQPHELFNTSDTRVEAASNPLYETNNRWSAIGDNQFPAPSDEYSSERNV
jgi:hypothetical protein